MAFDGFELHAWVDESMRSVDVEAPMYLLGAVIANPSECGPVRGRLRALLPSGTKLHWRDMDDRTKKQSTSLLSSFDHAHVVVVATPLNIRKQERARAVCLERMFFELGQMDVTRVCLESRTQSLNRRDMRLIDRLRGKQSMPPGLRVDIELPSAEPMLWIPDQMSHGRRRERR